MANADDSENTPSWDLHLADESSTNLDAAEICAGCNQPLIRRGPKGECLRCLMAFAFPAEDESFSGSCFGAEPSTKNVLRYGHFDIASGADGLPVELGRGGMAITYRAADSVLHSVVALKVINKKLAGHPEARARFLREARAAARLRHPNVASVSHYGEQDGDLFYVMELVEGETLEARVRREGPLSSVSTVEIAAQIARALAAAEACGVVHRDLKPSNVMLVARPGETGGGDAPLVKVIDWGLAKAVSPESALGADHTRDGFVGTPTFASPEHFAPAAERRVDARSDIYSLGLTLWYLLCGQTPLSGSTLEEIRASQLARALPVEQLRARRVAAPVIGLLRSMLALDPGQRPQSTRELLGALHDCQEKLSPARRRSWAVPAIVGVILALGLAVTVIVPRWVRPAPLQVGPPEQSLAILPFENLSPDPTDAFFTAGIQQKVASDLGHLADLKVLGGDSTSNYPPDSKRDLVAIGRDLAVKNLLEGSVRRENGHVQVAVRLINAGDPAKVWEARYDRPLAEVFALQSQMTRAIADRLQTPVSADANALIGHPPTADPKAYDLFLRSEALPDEAVINSPEDRWKMLHQVIALLEETVARDPSFALAYCRLSDTHLAFYLDRALLSPEERLVDHRRLAESALAAARRLQPDDGEVHMAVANYLCVASQDAPKASVEVNLARRTLPNNKWVEFLAGDLAFCQGRWEEALRCQEGVLTLDPRDAYLRSLVADSYRRLRRYADFERLQTQVIAQKHDVAFSSLTLALGPYESRADLVPLRAAIAANPSRANWYNFLLHFSQRDPGPAATALSLNKSEWVSTATLATPKAWYLARVSRMAGDSAGAQANFFHARQLLAEKLAADPGDAWTLGLLATCDAGLGRKEDAVREALRACELEPYGRPSNWAPLVRCHLALVYTWTGQPELALDQLEASAAQPSGHIFPAQPSYGDLQLNADWDPLRSNPRFAALVKRFAPPAPGL